MITGRHAFDGKTKQEVVEAVLAGEVISPDIDKNDPNMTPDAEDLIIKLTQLIP